jgi:hypothetical protein
MTETSVPPPQQTSSPGLPPVDPSALVATFVAVLKAPAEFFKSIKDEKGFQKVLVFSVAAWVVYGVLMLVERILYGWGVGHGIRDLVQAVISGFLGPFIGGAILWVICMVLGSKAPYEPAVRICGYSYAVLPIIGLCMLVPWIGWLAALVVGIYGIYIVVMGARTLLFEPAPAAPPAA